MNTKGLKRRDRRRIRRWLRKHGPRLDAARDCQRREQHALDGMMRDYRRLPWSTREAWRTL